METQRLFELCNRLSHVAFGHENFTEIVMWLSEFWVDVGRRLKMAFSFREVGLLEKQTSQINMRIEQTRIQSQRLSVVCNCFVDFVVLFQECAITVMRLRRFGR